MSEPSNTPAPKDRDEKIKLPDDPEEVLRALLKVDPDSEPVDEDEDEEPGTSDDD
jgi:hypothetical protein